MSLKAQNGGIWKRIIIAFGFAWSFFFIFRALIFGICQFSIDFATNIIQFLNALILIKLFIKEKKTNNTEN